jgi:hypothetical protein
VLRNALVSNLLAKCKLFLRLPRRLATPELEPLTQGRSHEPQAGKFSLERQDNPPYALFYGILRMDCRLTAKKVRLATISRQGFASQILAEQFTHFIRKLL